MNTIIHVLDIKAVPREVFFALTLKDGLYSWWTTRVDVNTDKGLLDFHFHDGFNPNMKVIRQLPDEEVRWQCIGGHDPWYESTLTFALEEHEGATQMAFMHTLVKGVSDVAYGRYNFNWGYYLDSLRLYCEEGQGKPFQA